MGVQVRAEAETLRPTCICADHFPDKICLCEPLASSNWTQHTPRPFGRKHQTMGAMHHPKQAISSPARGGYRVCGPHHAPNQRPFQLLCRRPVKSGVDASHPRFQALWNAVRRCVPACDESDDSAVQVCVPVAGGWSDRARAEEADQEPARGFSGIGVGFWPVRRPPVVPGVDPWARILWKVERLMSPVGLRRSWRRAVPCDVQN